MTQTIFRWLSLLILLTVMSILPASAEEEQIYTIKKGDTLWDLSQRFIEDPYYWPNVWANNPDITNPHLIFPGQKIRILDGRLEIIPAYPEAEKTEPDAPANDSSVAEALSDPEEGVTIKSAGSGVGFILTTEEPLGTLVDSVDNRAMLTRNDLVFLKMNATENVKVGDRYSLYSRGETIHHPQTKEPIGTKMYELGFLEVTETGGRSVTGTIGGKSITEKISGSTVTAKIDKTYREIFRGAELFNYAQPQKEISLQRGKADLKGHIIAAREGKMSQSFNDVIFIDLGSDHGLRSGNLIYISRPRQASDEILKQAGDIELPDEVLGAAVVIEPSLKSATAIIIKSVNAMFIGDRVTVVGN